MACRYAAKHSRITKAGVTLKSYFSSEYHHITGAVFFFFCIHTLSMSKKHKTGFHLELPPEWQGKQPRILLHACCAPCSSSILEALVAEGHRPTVYFCNPNIYPEQEYMVRKEELIRYLAAEGIDFVDADDHYDHRTWRTAVRGYEHEPERGHRCQLCFNVRLRRTAQYAAEHGFDLFTTTLAGSRWKDLEQVLAAGRSGAAAYPATAYWEQNWRKGGLSERRAILLREKKFYNQQYCGCEFSLKQMLEWRAQRAAQLAKASSDGTESSV